MKPKENQHGIGYRGLDRTSVLGTRTSASSGHFNLFDIPAPASKTGSGKRDPKGFGKGLKISGQAFGVGAFEEDDDDVYSRDDMSNYDFSLPSRKVPFSHY